MLGIHFNVLESALNTIRQNKTRVAIKFAVTSTEDYLLSFKQARPTTRMPLGLQSLRDYVNIRSDIFEILLRNRRFTIYLTNHSVP